MKLIHPSIPLIADLTKFENIYSLSHLVEYIHNHSEKMGSTDYTANSIKGDMFEIFVEYFIKELGTHNDVNIANYKPGGVSRDLGVDGVGIAGDGEKAAVQVKFKHDPRRLIDHEEASKFFGQSILEVKIDQNNLRNLLFITTSTGFNHIVEELYGSRGMRVLGRKQLQRIIGPENKPFWDGFRKAFLDGTKGTERKQYKRMKHQAEALESFKNSTAERVQIIMPTGAGKTMTEHDVVSETINKGGLISLVCAPRIALVDSLLKNFHEFADNNWIHRVFSSGKKELLELYEGDVHRNANPTTSKMDIERDIKFALANKKPLIIFSTYHSVHKIGDVLNKMNVKADILVADEAHNLTRTDWNKYLREDKIPFKKCAFFTATRRVALNDKKIGMNNKDLFGELIHKVEPKMMIESGCIVPPRIQFVEVEPDKSNLEASIVERSIRYFKENIRKSKDCRIIVSCASADEAHDLADSVELQNALSEFTLSAITSKAHRMGGETRREIFKNYLKAKNAIIFHYDIISEGIDLPGTTAVMPMRTLPPIKATQTIGRALRITTKDREALRNGRIEVGNVEGWQKPFGYVIVSHLKGDFESELAAHQLEEIIYNLRTSGYDPDVELNETEDKSSGGIDEEISPYASKQKLIRLEDIENNVRIRIESREEAFSPIKEKSFRNVKDVRANLHKKLCTN